jgi:tripartite-type tricarboxylate transporter receptor subunit TctC
MQHSPLRRWCLRLALAALTAVAGTGSALAQGYPDKPIRFFVSYPAGGGADFVARHIAQVLGTHLGQPVVVENRPGASGIIAAQATANAPPDGHTIFLADNATLVFNSAMFDKLPYDPMKDFTFISLVAKLDMMLAVPEQSPIKDMKQFLAAAKAKPGGMSYGSPGIGLPHHLGVELFLQESRLRAVPAQYQGIAPAIRDLIGGQVDFVFVDLAAGLPHIKGGRVRALAVASANRLGALPDLPTFSEEGFPGFEAYAWQGIVMPAGVPPAVVERFSRALRETMRDEGLRTQLRNAGVEPLGSTPDQMRAHMATETRKWHTLIKARGITRQ